MNIFMSGRKGVMVFPLIQLCKSVHYPTPSKFGAHPWDGPFSSTIKVLNSTSAMGGSFCQEVAL